MAAKRKKRRRGRSRARNGAPPHFPAASGLADHDALYQHFLDLAYERMKDPEYRALVEEFIEKTYLFLARKRRKEHAGFAAGRSQETLPK